MQIAELKNYAVLILLFRILSRSCESFESLCFFKDVDFFVVENYVFKRGYENC